jgi:hypothetical protein
MLLSAEAKAADCAPFEWGAITAGDLTITKGAVLVKVDIEGVGNDVVLQLDTGSATTELYGEAVSETVAKTGPQSRIVTIPGWRSGGKSLPIAVRPASGIAGQSAGTLGTDFLGDGFVLDLEHRRICEHSAINEGQFANWQPITKVNGSPVVDALEDGAPLRLLLDTGSSGFTLLSTPNLSATVRTATPLRQLKVPSFGRLLNVGELTPTAGMTVMGQPITLAAVYSLDDPDVEGMLKSAGLNGLLGLRPFAGGALAFDFAKQRMAFGRLQE